MKEEKASSEARQAVEQPTRKVRGRGAMLARTGMRSDNIVHEEIVPYVDPLLSGKKMELIHNYDEWKDNRTEYNKHFVPTRAIESGTFFILFVLNYLGHILEVTGPNLDLDRIGEELAIPAERLRSSVMKVIGEGDEVTHVTRVVVIFDSAEEGVWYCIITLFSLHSSFRG